MMRDVALAVACVLFATASVAAQSCTWGDVGGGVDGPVHAIQVFDDGSGPAIYVGGDFTMAGGVPAANIARWDGAAWSAVGGGTDGPVHALEVFDDTGGTMLFAGGDFSIAGGQAASNIARWDGSSWNGLWLGTNAPVRALAVYNDNTAEALYVGGEFTEAGGGSALYVIRYYGGGFFWAPLPTGTDGPVRAFAVRGTGLYLGGDFDNVGGMPSSKVARWNGLWVPLTTDIPPSGSVETLAVHGVGTGPDVYAGGDFSSATPFLSNVVQVTGTGAPVSVGGGLDGGAVHSLASFDDGSGSALYAGGAFDQNASSGDPMNGIARWNGAGAWSRVHVGEPDGPINVLSVLDVGAGNWLFAGGAFSTIGTAAAANVAVRGSDCPAVEVTQPGGIGAPVTYTNSNLVPGNEYYNLVSFELCPVVGSGNVFGICATSNLSIELLIGFLNTPIGNPPVHYVAFGPTQSLNLYLGPMMFDVICIDVTGGTVSPVHRATIQ